MTSAQGRKCIITLQILFAQWAIAQESTIPNGLNTLPKVGTFMSQNYVPYCGSLYDSSSRDLINIQSGPGGLDCYSVLRAYASIPESYAVYDGTVGRLPDNTTISDTGEILCQCFSLSGSDGAKVDLCRLTPGGFPLLNAQLGTKALPKCDQVAASTISRSLSQSPTPTTIMTSSQSIKTNSTSPVSTTTSESPTSTNNIALKLGLGPGFLVPIITMLGALLNA